MGCRGVGERPYPPFRPGHFRCSLGCHGGHFGNWLGTGHLHGADFGLGAAAHHAASGVWRRYFVAAPQTGAAGAGSAHPLPGRCRHLAIYDGIWTIDPAQTINWYLGGILPFEEFLFFLITNVLVTFGMTLFLAAESQERLAQLKTAVTRWRASRLPIASEK